MYKATYKLLLHSSDIQLSLLHTSRYRWHSVCISTISSQQFPLETVAKLVWVVYVRQDTHSFC